MRHFPKTILVLAATAGFASAVDPVTSYTTPVGYVTVDVPANSDKAFAVPLERASLINTVATAASGTTLTIKATGLALNDLQYTPVTQTNTYHVRFLSGSLTGQYFAITGNAATDDNGTPGDTTDDTTDVTLDTTISISGTPSIKVVPYWTLGTLFPGGAGVGVSTNASPDAAGFFMTCNQAGTGINRSPETFYVYSDGTFSDTTEPGWYDLNDLFSLPLDDMTINPEDMFYIRNNTVATPQSLVVDGTVPNSDTVTGFAYLELDQNDNYVAASFPVDTALADSGLFDPANPTTCAVRNSPNPAAPVDYVLVFRSVPESQNESFAKAYFYQDGTDPDTPVAGWYDNDDYFAGVVTDKVIKAGQGFVIRKGLAASDGTGTWTAPRPYSLTN